MTEDAHDSDAINKTAKEVSLPEDKCQIKTAMRSRFAYFKEQADTLTFEGVRRLLEKDLGLETLALDVHKRFIKQCLLECLGSRDDGNASKNSGEIVDTNVSTTSEVAELPKRRQSKKVKVPCSEDEQKMEDSPVMGLLSGHKTASTEINRTEHEETKEVSKGEIKKAIRKRASYVVAHSDKVTMAGLRRLLEEDMKLDKHTLDPYKKFISEQLDEVLKSCEVSAPASKAKSKTLKKDSQSKASRKSSTKESSDSSEDLEEEKEEEEGRHKGKLVSKERLKNSEGNKKRKRPEKEIKTPSKKRAKAAEKVSDVDNDAEDGGVVPEDGHSQSSAERSVKRKEASTPAYGKRVEHLKSVIKSCGMSVPPAIYKKVKQAPENKREAHLIKELEGILSKEGLSPNPTEKEIKEVRKRKERARELEGIDMSNIVSSSRRRSTTSFLPPPKPKTDATDDDDTEHTDDDDDENEDNDDDEDGGVEGNDGSQSEDSNQEENDEDSD